MNDVQKLANRFSKLMREQLTQEELIEVNKRNKANNDNSCASHDFCDANMVMHQAFIEERDVDMSDEVNSDQEWLWDQWNEAWDIAKKAGFSIEVVEEPEDGSAEIRISLTNSVITVFHSDGNVLLQKTVVKGDWGKMWDSLNTLLK